jgi:hypothetical protein
MNLRLARPAPSDKRANARDPKEPHLFHESIPGGPCAVCRRGKSDRLHQGVEVDESPRWGF